MNNIDSGSLSQQEIAEGYLAWHDITIHASHWLQCGNIRPDEAAKLLVCIDPLGGDDPSVYCADGDKEYPGRYLIMKRLFEDVERTDCKHRTLLEWRDIAKQKGLRYHPWIDEYENAFALLQKDIGQNATSGSQSKSRPPPQQRYQEQEILRVIKELKYDPTKLPKDTPGKSGVKAEVRGRLNFSTGVFNKAWERLSHTKEIIKLR